MSMMDDDDDVPYHSNTYAINGQKFPLENAGNSYGEDDDDDDDDDVDDDDDEKGEEDLNDDDDGDDDDGGNGVQRIGNDEYDDDDEDNDYDDDGYGNQQRHLKKRKLKNLISGYEFAPRLPPPPSPPPAPTPPPPPKPSYGGRNPLTDWTEHETFVLLNSWGDRFLKHGRKSLRSEEWQEVAEKVSQESKIERSDTQCRNRLDTLKKKYKKEKAKSAGAAALEWVYFKKMDSLLSASQPLQAGLSCGVDSGEYVFMNPKVYLNRSNGLDEMRDSSTEGEEDELEGIPPKKAKDGKTRSFKMLTDSFQKFGEIYERIEKSKRAQMVELEKMRMDFHRELELQKREIVERAQAEIARIRDEDNGENISG